MSDVPVPPQGRAAPMLILCRQCVQYVFEGTVTCPHCGRDAREMSARYREGDYLAIETIRRIERAAERRRG
jgi:uncharacterized Zn finger protein (UPF0148 family)